MNEQARWVILEAMGHIKVAGRYFVENGLHRVDIPDPSDPELFRTEWYGNAAIFRITPVDELTARHVAKQSVIPDAIPFNVMNYVKQLAAPEETLNGNSINIPNPEDDEDYDPYLDDDDAHEDVYEEPYPTEEEAIVPTDPGGYPDDDDNYPF